MANEEKMLNVPLDGDTKEWLEERAAKNDRYIAREAAAIIKAEKKRDERKGK